MGRVRVAKTVTVTLTLTLTVTVTLTLTRCAAGTYGAAWKPAWGGFELWARPGSTGAGEACCQCGGG